jgi:hypothetical protein
MERRKTLHALRHRFSGKVASPEERRMSAIHTGYRYIN